MRIFADQLTYRGLQLSFLFGLLFCSQAHSGLSNESKKFYEELFETHFLPGLMGMHDTSLEHRHDGKWSPERKQLHQEILEKSLGTSHHFLPLNGATSLYLLFSGSAGSGKSTLLEKWFEEGVLSKEKFAVIDPDQIRNLLPEYQHWLSEPFKLSLPGIKEALGNLSQKESMYLTNLCAEMGMNQGKNLISSGTMVNSEFYGRFINRIKTNKYGNKYRVGIIHIDVESEIAWERNVIRSEQIGRKANLAFFDRANPLKVSLSMDRLKNLTDFYIKIDMSGPDALVKESFFNEAVEKNNEQISIFLDQPTSELNVVLDQINHNQIKSKRSDDQDWKIVLN